MITIIDMGIGNLRSLSYKIEQMGFGAKITCSPTDIKQAKKLILPGVGHFAEAMKNIDRLGLFDVLSQKALKEKIPILGICLGAQLITKKSSEGNARGLGWIDAKTKKFDFSNTRLNLKVPHVGWNKISVKNTSFILDGVDLSARFYFTHSYYIECHDKDLVVATTGYGFDFASIVQKDNIIGIQFHPEKSHLRGMKIIENFCRD